MTIFRYILQFLLLKIDKRDVWDSKRPLRMKWQLSDFGEKQGFPNFPQNHCPCPHLKLWGFLGNLSLKIPKSLVLPIPEFSPKNLKTLSPSPPCPQISGQGRGFPGNGDTIGLTIMYFVLHLLQFWLIFYPKMARNPDFPTFVFLKCTKNPFPNDHTLKLFPTSF